jgi:catechol 2,3-dioxygenase-like lactoylglutathione lyase family enzyme
MLAGLDHVVIGVADLAAAVRGYAALGFLVEPGGRHPRGTHNALVGLADGTYLELLAFHEPAPDHRWWEPVQQGGGVIDYALAATDLAGAAAALRRAGVAMEDRGRGGRTRPDGHELRWTLAVPPRAERGVAPFLIEDATPRAERVPRGTAHPNGARGIATLVVATRDPARAARWFAALGGAAAAGVARPALGGAGFHVRLGAQAIEFLAPGGGGGLLAERLARRGPGPVGLVLRTAGARPGPLPRALAQGAGLELR